MNEDQRNPQGRSRFNSYTLQSYFAMHTFTFSEIIIEYNYYLNVQILHSYPILTRKTYLSTYSSISHSSFNSSKFVSPTSTHISVWLPSGSNTFKCNFVLFKLDCSFLKSMQSLCSFSSLLASAITLLSWYYFFLCHFSSFSFLLPVAINHSPNFHWKNYSTFLQSISSITDPYLYFHK